MAVYVDHLAACCKSSRWRWDRSCHMVADSVEELHEFAARIGMKRSWFQHRPGRVPHYDLTEGRRAAAVELGAQEIGRYELYWGWIVPCRGEVGEGAADNF